MTGAVSMRTCSSSPGHSSRFRLEHPIFRRRRFFQGTPVRGTGMTDIAWFRPDGARMTDEDWSVSYARSLGVFLNGAGIVTPDKRGQRILDDSFFLAFNAHYEPLSFALPGKTWGADWREMIRTGVGMVEHGPVRRGGELLQVDARELVVLQLMEHADRRVSLSLS